MKTCSKCKIEKELGNFYRDKSKNDGYHTVCKECQTVRKMLYYKENKTKIIRQNSLYKTENKEKINQQNSLYRKVNKEKIKESDKMYRKTNKEVLKFKKKIYRDLHKPQMKRYRELNKDKIKEKTVQYRTVNRNRIKKVRNVYYTSRKKKDPLFKLSCDIRSAILRNIKSKSYTKKSKTAQILGCSFEFLHKHLKQTFENNYFIPFDQNTRKVHIDHIIPVSSAKNEEEVLKLNHFSNLQYLYAEDNMAKADKLNWTLPR